MSCIALSALGEGVPGIASGGRAATPAVRETDSSVRSELWIEAKAMDEVNPAML
jgi:hypothetical protein